MGLRARERLLFLLVLIPWGFFLWTGNRAIDFGHHWDEPLLLTNLKTSLSTGTLLPTGTCNYPYPDLAGGNYEYPSLLYWVGMANCIPPAIEHAIHPTAPQAVNVIATKLFAIRLRQSCLAISSLAILWTFLLARQITGKWWVGLIASCLLAGSWEISFHSRWIAPDVILMQFSPLCLWLCALVTGGRREIAARSAKASSGNPQPARCRLLLLLAAGVAGLAMGTKYPGAVLLVPVMITALMVWPRGSSMVDQILWLPRLVLVMVATFIITTPGAILQPWNFIAWLNFDHFHYSRMGHYGHTILNHTAHLQAMLQYLGLVLFSAYPWIAGGITLLALAGMLLIAIRSWRSALIVLPVILIYLAYFSQQIVMLVRNLLILGPLLAVLAAVGAAGVAEVIRKSPQRYQTGGIGAAVIVLGALLGMNWLQVAGASSGASVRVQLSWQLQRAKDYLADHPGLRVFPSDTVADMLHLPAVATANGDSQRDVVLCFEQENVDQNDFWQWPANIRNLSLRTFGPTTVNFNDYPNWMDNQLVLLDIDQARRVPVAQVERAVHRHDIAAALPANQKLLVYFNCGSSRQVKGGGITITATRGTEYPCARDVAVPQPDALTIEADNREITFEISGLSPAKSYNLGWSWWDWNTGRRFESITMESSSGKSVQLCPATALPAWPLTVDPQPHHLPSSWPSPAIYRAGVRTADSHRAALPMDLLRDGSCSIHVHREKGPDVVITGLWIIQNQ